jgi:16S rRNA (adenine1518-N6/adenine1519-N6)-dimethyltransferase
LTEAHLTPLERLRRSGIAPDHGLGQNFLIDPNILDVIERMASLTAEDIVLEVGPGLGVLTERLLDRCQAVHCLELDRRLAALLTEEFSSRRGFFLHMGDAMRLDFSVLEPPPDKFVANLPYNVAAPLVMRSLSELPSIRLWCLMLQKEIADRLFAEVGAANYGGVSVMVQLLTERLSSRTVPATVFYPRPRVRSSLLAFSRRERRGYAVEDFTRVKTVVYAAFSHRRKMLVNSLAEAGPGVLPGAAATMPLPERKAWLEGLLKELGKGGGVRPQELEPLEFEELVRLMDEGPA